MTESSEPALGLRERKKLETRFKIFQTAMDLFVAKGFDNVSVAQIAEASNVSKVTVFNYFPTKEDLVMTPLSEQSEDPGKAVRERAPGESAVAALRRRLLEEIDQYDPQVGLSTAGLDFIRVIHGSSSLAARVMYLDREKETKLAATLAAETAAEPGDLTPHVVAAAIMAVTRAIVSENWRRLLAGETPESIRPHAVINTEKAFAALEAGLTGYGTG
ncbi:TetR/AcrR family transcriptional regulator [Streptomyces sp. NPDC048516]|uniref:TetR/AcrR family transcriptional regulator n=1 Tax=Streptomyces sp. NPDC048516 TaxID=3365565 RepID=UPI00371DE856